MTRRKALLRVLLVTTALIGAIVLASPSHADDQQPKIYDEPIPPMPFDYDVSQAARVLGAPTNNPITGSKEDAGVIGGHRPPSLEALQALRPGIEPEEGMDEARAGPLANSALSYGARGGLAARAFAINEMLRRYEARLDASFDFRPLVLTVNGGQTLLRPPVITEAQLAFALGDGGQIARETGTIYEITRQAQLTSAPPNWRSYLVRSWQAPTAPPDELRPKTKQEAAFWNKWVAEGWAKGERQAVEIFLSDLSRLERDMEGMARYRVLLRAGLVERPDVNTVRRAVDGDRNKMWVNDQTVEIKDQRGLNPQMRRWAPPGDRSLQVPPDPLPQLPPAQLPAVSPLASGIPASGAPRSLIP